MGEKLIHYFMKSLIVLICFLNLGFVSCQQKKFFINFQKLEAKELRIYYEKADYPKLQTDKDGHFYASFDTSNTLYTSTTFKEIKNLRNVFCLTPEQQCLYDDYELERLGFAIIVNSHFQSDTTNKKPYINPYESFLIEKVKVAKNE